MKKIISLSLEVNSYDELLDFVLATYETKIMPLEKFQKLFIALCISYKGLTAQEIMLLVKKQIFK